ESAGQRAAPVGDDVGLARRMGLVVVRDQPGPHSAASLPSGRSRRGGLRSEHRVAGECIDGAEATCADRVETYPRAFDIGKVRLLRANVITGNADGGDDDRDKKRIAHSRPHPPVYGGLFGGRQNSCARSSLYGSQTAFGRGS